MLSLPILALGQDVELLRRGRGEQAVFDGSVLQIFERLEIF